MISVNSTFLIILHWLLLGSLGLNLLWMIRSRKEFTQNELSWGFWVGLILGPLTLVWSIYHSIKEEVFK